MKKLIGLLILVLTLNLLLVSGVAAEEDKGKAFTLEEVVVTASKHPEKLSESPVSVEVIDGEDINNKNAHNVADLLKDVGSVQINNHGGIAGQKTISIRGSSASQVLVLIDGQPMNNSQNGQIDLSQLSIEQIEKIEVLRGPASALYGANALGGVVNIITKTGSGKPEASLQVGYGAFNTQKYNLTYQGSTTKLNYNLGVTKKKSEGHRTVPDNDELDQLNIFTKFDYQLTNYSNLILSAKYNDSDKGVPGTITSPSPNAQQDDKDINVNLKWKRKAENNDLNLAIYYNKHKQNYYNKYYSNQDNTFDYTRYYRNEAGDIYYYDQNGEKKEAGDINVSENITDDVHTTKRLGLDLSRTMYYQSHTLTYGGEVKKNKIDSTKNGEHETLNKALFIQDEWEVTSPLKVTLGGRYDLHDVFGSEISPRLGAVYTINNNLNLHASAGKSYRAPTFNDLYWPASIYAEGNPDLKPETAIAYEVGSNYLTKETKVNLNYFQRDVEDLIDSSQGEDGKYRPYNVHKAKIKGIELSLNKNLIKNISAGFNYTYLDARNTTEDKRLSYRPYHTANFDLAYDNQKFNTVLNGKLVDGRPNDLDAYFVINTKASKQFNFGSQDFKVALEVNNLLDRKYEVVENYPMPERNYMLEVSTKF